MWVWEAGATLCGYGGWDCWGGPIGLHMDMFKLVHLRTSPVNRQTDRMTERKTDMAENITFPQLSRRAVIINAQHLHQLPIRQVKVSNRNENICISP